MVEMPVLSVVIPAFNEAGRLPATLDRIGAFLASRADWRPAEVIVVDDGSRDATAGAIAGAKPVTGIEFRVIRLEANRGKGAAVRIAMAASRGVRVLVSDADLATPIEEIDALLAARALVAFGSRALRRELIAQRQPRFREAMGRCFNLLVRGLGLSRMHDTQCGFKLIDGDLARRLATEMRLNGFAFDIELLARAARRGAACVEIPVRWAHVEASRVQPLRHSLQMARDILRLRCWLWLGR